MPTKREPIIVRRYLPKFDESIDVKASINEVANQYALAHLRAGQADETVKQVESSDAELQDLEQHIAEMEDELAALKTLRGQAKERLAEEQAEVYEARDDAHNILANVRKTLALYATIGRVQGHWDAKCPLGQVAGQEMYLQLMEVDVEITDPLEVIKSIPNWQGMFKIALTMGNPDYATERRGVNDFILKLMNEANIGGVQLRPDTLVVNKKTSWLGTPLLMVNPEVEIRNGSESATGEATADV